MKQSYINVSLTEDELADMEEASIVLTYLLYYVNPTIDKEETYDIVLGYVMKNGLTIDNVKDMGREIRSTAKTKGTKNGKKESKKH